MADELQLRIWLSVRLQCEANAGLVRGHSRHAHHERPFRGCEARCISFFAVVEFPGALHEGNGQLPPISDERATAEQREALFNIMSGKYAAEGTLFHICSLIVTKMHPPIFAPIALSFDKAARTARLVIPGVLESDVEPIKNPVTGAPHRIQVMMPEGFEHREGEVESCSIRSSGAIKFDTHASHSTLAHVVQTPEGVVA